MQNCKENVHGFWGPVQVFSSETIFISAYRPNRVNIRRPPLLFIHELLIHALTLVCDYLK